MKISEKLSEKESLSIMIERLHTIGVRYDSAGWKSLFAENTGFFRIIKGRDFVIQEDLARG